MSNKTHCPSCGAPIDLERKTCAYCDTPYIKENSLDIFIDTKSLTDISRMLEYGMITANEARRLNNVRM